MFERRKVLKASVVDRLCDTGSENGFTLAEGMQACQNICVCVCTGNKVWR